MTVGSRRYSIMANQDRRPPPQPAEDMFGRPTDVRHEKDEGAPTREQQGAHVSPRHARADEESRERSEKDAGKK
jgi:hypothetical protein